MEFFEVIIGGVRIPEGPTPGENGPFVLYLGVDEPLSRLIAEASEAFFLARSFLLRSFIIPSILPCVTSGGRDGLPPTPPLLPTSPRFFN